MIRIFQMGEVEEDKIFARTKDTTDRGILAPCTM